MPGTAGALLASRCYRYVLHVSSDSEFGLLQSDTWKHLVLTQRLLSHTHQQNGPHVTCTLQKAPLQHNVLRWKNPLGLFLFSQAFLSILYLHFIQKLKTPPTQEDVCIGSNLQ